MQKKLRQAKQALAKMQWKVWRLEKMTSKGKNLEGHQTDTSSTSDLEESEDSEFNTETSTGPVWRSTP